MSENSTTSHNAPRLVAGRNGGTLKPIAKGDMRLVEARRAKKHALVKASAQASVQDGRLVGKFGGWAWLAEVTQNQMAIATTPDAGKAATLAATWLVNNAGLAEPTRSEHTDTSATTYAQGAADAGDVLAAVAAEFFRRVRDAATSADVVEGTVRE